MPLEENKTDSYPGAGAMAFPPFGAEDCCLLPSLGALEDELQSEGVPIIWKGGALMIGETLQEVEARCVLGMAEISSVVPDPLIENSAATVNGQNYGTAEGEVWITDNASWDASVVKVEQTVTDWTATAIDITVSADGLPGSPTHVYVFVDAPCGTRNAVGFETEMVTE